MNNTKKQLAYRVAIYEYERGWGSKIDDYMICLSEEDANSFMDEHNSKNNKTEVPDWYSVAREVTPIAITQSQFNFVTFSESKRAWWMHVKNK